jgi:aryl-alcohol dehydrogenase-like predicted oxidoreductase
MEAHAHSVLDEAWRLGIRYFDAARSYGRAEQFLSSWLRSRNIGTAEVAVASKWGYTYTADWQIEAEHHEVKEHSLEVLRRQWGESRSNLGPYLKLYQIHSATLESGVLTNREVLGELAKIKASGCLIGLSLSGPQQASTLDKALSVEVDGSRLFDSVQATWNILETSAGPALQAAHATGMGVVVKEALANGRLTDRNKASDFTSKGNHLTGIARKLNTTIDALALGFVMSQSWVDVVLSGAATIDQVRSNSKTLELLLSAELRTELYGLSEEADQYWRIRSNLDWN